MTTTHGESFHFPVDYLACGSFRLVRCFLDFFSRNLLHHRCVDVRVSALTMAALHILLMEGCGGFIHSGLHLCFFPWHDGMRRLIRCYDAGTDLQGCGLYYAPSLGAQQVAAAPRALQAYQFGGDQVA